MSELRRSYKRFRKHSPKKVNVNQDKAKTFYLSSPVGMYVLTRVKISNYAEFLKGRDQLLVSSSSSTLGTQ